MVKGLKIFSKLTNSCGELAIVEAGITKPKNINKTTELCRKIEKRVLSSLKILGIFINKNFETITRIIGTNTTTAVKNSIITNGRNFEVLILVITVRETKNNTATAYHTFLLNFIL